MSESELMNYVDTVRDFNRFYTRHIGVLREGLLHTPYSLTEARIIFELANRPDVTASTLASDLGLDPGYLTRVLNKFEKRSLVERIQSETDRRKRLINLTEEGREAFNLLDARASNEVTEVLEEMSISDRQALVEAMHTIKSVLSHGFKYADPFYLRPHKPGDMGWVIHQHALLYNKEYGWDEDFEALVAEICADFIKNYDPEWERCWIAEVQGQQVGSVFCVRASEEVAKLRLLLVVPTARRLGLGTRLVDECIRFTRRCGYKTLTLWTNDVLVDARRLYERKRFELVEEDPHHSFGHDLVGQNWALSL